MPDTPENLVYGTPLHVPYTEREVVRMLGAQWAWWLGLWYVPEGVDLSPFRRWLTRAAEERGPVDMWTILCHPDEL